MKEEIVALLTSKSPAAESTPRTFGRVLLGSAMVFAGVGHLTFARQDFQAQVPDFVPLDPDVTVLASGVVEIALGSSLVLLKSRRAAVGLVLAVFFVAVFPGNIAQWANHRDAFGLDTDQARATRLIFQPVLIAWALWSTGAWDALRGRR
ncbi:DoxX family protein [Williamsia soli]|uniref:DoxX family protein n=1 Tax=Williamsia soli TaxID=364929 RepID=UPI0035564362